MRPDLQLYTNALWMAVLLVWLFASFNVKRTTVTQPSAFRALQVSLLIAGFFLIFSRALNHSVWAHPLLPSFYAVPDIGFFLTLTGLVFAVWARFSIGRNWSSNVTLKQDHQLIRSGPYRLVRHPIYSGFLLALFGTALVGNELCSYLGLLLCALGFHLKASVEEKFMNERFESEYAQYRHQTKALIPFVL